jgi:acetylornithine deacetylase/succinyl-diaminopimelate desuccinylase-like protein
MAIFRCSAACALFVCAALAVPAPGSEPHAVDWDSVAREALEHLSALLRIHTVNPPGNETEAAQYLAEVLQREGIPAKLLALDPARANLVARLKGNGSRKPVIVMGHTDVVGVERKRWSVDPFAATRQGGYIYGRGAQDDKDHVTAGLMLLLLLNRLRVPLDRDVVFLAEAGEEGSTRVGIDFLIDRHWDEIAGEFALAEGGSMLAEHGEVRYVEITTTEKVPRGIRLIARGTAGHASRPTADNPLLHLAQAVARFESWQPPMRLNSITRAYFERLAAISRPEDAVRYRSILDPALAPSIERYFFRHEPGHYTILRTTVTPTMLQAGFRHNVIPSQAEAYLDVRALPDEDIDALCVEVRRVIADPDVEVVPPQRGGRPVAPPSRTDTEMFRALESAQRRMFPRAITLPGMLAGATDLAQLRARGVQAYGFGPLVYEAAGGAHGDDERLPESSLLKLVQYLWYTVLQVAASKP